MLNGCQLACKPGDHVEGCANASLTVEAELAATYDWERSAWAWWQRAQEHRRKLQELLLKRRAA
jgi:hypothetical protein